VSNTCGTGKTGQAPRTRRRRASLAPLIKPPTGLGRVPAGDAIVADLVAAGYVVKDKDGPRQRTIGEMLDLLIGANPRQRSPDMRDR
jgi:hypothetical protein